MTTPPMPSTPQPQAPAQAPAQAGPAAAGAPPFPGQAGATYTSPIPIRSTHIGDAIASEWTKIRSVRSTVWTLGIMIFLMLGLGLLIAWGVSYDDGELVDVPALTLGFTGVLLGSLCVITLGVLTVSSEYGTGMMRTTLTACPNRGRVLAAKALVFFALVFTITTVTATVVAVLQTSMVDAVDATGSEWLRGTVGVGCYIALLGLISLAVGSLVRHSAGAITIMLGVVLLPLVAAMFLFAESMEELRRGLLEYSIPSQLSVLYGNTVTDSGPQGWTPVLFMLVLALVALGGALAVLESRDV
ncbi:ABC transporter permease subunit [Streptomyces apocyni]|uniref:ABC transporter permease subunit n=1 Tax=Streptomyces apocyni TaxID=2654677 RepID=UPI0012EAA6A4|nr:ABC transporter permease subunit [Streptomyces apocyni]